MSKINDGGPAFPTTEWGRTQKGELAQQQIGGMSLRDYFAGQIACNLFNGYESTVGMNGFHHAVYTTVAREAYRFADALIAARTKEHTHAD